MLTDYISEKQLLVGGVGVGATFLLSSENRIRNSVIAIGIWGLEMYVARWYDQSCCTGDALNYGSVNQYTLGMSVNPNLVRIPASEYEYRKRIPPGMRPLLISEVNGIESSDGSIMLQPPPSNFEGVRFVGRDVPLNQAPLIAASNTYDTNNNAISMPTLVDNPGSAGGAGTSLGSLINNIAQAVSSTSAPTYSSNQERLNDLLWGV